MSPDDEVQIAKVMATTGTDRCGALEAMLDAKRLVAQMIAAQNPKHSSACAKCGHDPNAKVTENWGLSLDKRIESANSYTVNSGASRWRYAKERDEWQWLIKAATALCKIRRAQKAGKRRVTITRHYTGRCKEMDRDNLSVKPLVDALVREAVLFDDDASHLELHVLQMRTQVNLTHVLIEELP